MWSPAQAPAPRNAWSAPRYIGQPRASFAPLEENEWPQPSTSTPSKAAWSSTSSARRGLAKMARELNPSRYADSPEYARSSIRQQPLAQPAPPLLRHEGPLQPIGQPEQAKVSPVDDEGAKERKVAAQAARDAERLALRARLEELQMEEAYGNDSDDFEEEEGDKENEKEEDDEDEEEMDPEDHPPRPPRTRHGENLDAGAGGFLELLAKHLSVSSSSSSTNKSLFDAEMVKILKLKGKLDPEEKETFLDDFAMQISLADEEAGWLLQLPVDHGWTGGGALKTGAGTHCCDAWSQNCPA